MMDSPDGDIRLHSVCICMSEHSVCSMPVLFSCPEAERLDRQCRLQALTVDCPGADTDGLTAGRNRDSCTGFCACIGILLLHLCSPSASCREVPHCTNAVLKPVLFVLFIAFDRANP